MIVDGKVVVVTGVGPGLGAEIVRAALRDGANVVVAARNEDRLEALASELDPTGERICVHPADIGDPDQCQRLLGSGAERFGGIDAVVQVAAVDYLMGGVIDTSLDDWKLSLEANVVGTVNVVRAAVPHLKERGGGAVVLVGSQAAYKPALLQVAYAAAKGALLSAMYHMAKELGPDRIRVNTVVPTWMWGPPVKGYVAWQSGERGISEDEVVAEITAGMPLGEIPADEDVAEAVVFFCSDRARMITGQSLMVNAGEVMR